MEDRHQNTGTALPQEVPVTLWQFRPVQFKFQLSDLTLFSFSLPMQTRSVRLSDETPPAAAPELPLEPLETGSQGFLIRALPVATELPHLAAIGGFLQYVPLQYAHCYIDLRTTFESYQSKFSSKTRATIGRKIRKYAEHSGGKIEWKSYADPADMLEFLRFARDVSKKTYQEKLLDAGIPESDEFVREMLQLAESGLVRAYILFDQGRAVSYLYCPVQNGTLIYAYLGYDPSYMKHSVGTVLQWLAVEQMFEESKFKFFDFTEGQSDHKRLFATHQVRCANVFLVKSTMRNALIVHSHRRMDQFSRWLGLVVARYGLKEWIKRKLRFG